MVVDSGFKSFIAELRAVSVVAAVTWVCALSVLGAGINGLTGAEKGFDGSADGGL